MGDAWAGDPDRGIPSWRDTGVEVCGPAVADAEAAFADAWKMAGGLIPQASLPARRSPPRGKRGLEDRGRFPETAGLYRLDLIVAATACKTLWLADAYFMGTTAYNQALRSAALDGWMCAF